MAAHLSFIVGIIGNVISILVFASPIGTFRRIVMKKSIENFKGDPYVTTLLSTSLWSFYGLLKPDGILIVTVNGTGFVMQAIYVALFLIYAPMNTRVKMSMLVAILNIGFFGLVLLVTLLALHGSLKLTVVGFLCASFTVGMYASPLSSMRTVVKTKSVEYMPFSLTFFLFLNGGIWTAYSLLVKDFFICVPNAIGLVMGIAQLIIYAIYRKATPRKADEFDEEEGPSDLTKLQEDVDLSDQNWHLKKGNSLPKPSLVRQPSIEKIAKSISLTPNELQSILQQQQKKDLHINNAEDK